MNRRWIRGVSSHQLADYDQPYTWALPPSMYLPLRAIIRLAILRAKLESVRDQRGTRLRAANGRVDRWTLQVR